MGYTVLEAEGHVGTLTLRRPEALNALCADMLRELEERLEEIVGGGLRCLILTGAGNAFAAGADIAEMRDLDPAGAEAFSLAGNRLMERIAGFPIPVLAAVNGYALGGGLELALCCDIRVASEKAVFALPEAGLGVLPGYGGVQRLARLVGVSKAKELAFTTDRVGAAEALRLGLVNAVAPPEELMDRCREMAERIAGNAPVAVRAIKEVANRSVGLPLDKSAGLESELFGSCFATRDQKEAMRAFLEKRKPEPFTGS